MRNPKMSTAVLAAFATLAILTASAGWAQEKLEDQPGYLPFEELDILGSDEFSVEINLAGPLLKLVAGATRKAEPEFSQLIAGLDAVRVRVAPLEDLDLEEVRGGIARATGWLEERGWQTIVRAREDDEEIYIYLLESEGVIAGLAILAIEAGDEAVVINIVGKIDLSQLELLGEALDIPQLSRPPEPTDEEESDP